MTKTRPYPGWSVILVCAEGGTEGVGRHIKGGEGE